jgi:hypothetical protein
MDNLEKKIKELLDQSGAGKETCPDELELAALIEGTLEPEHEQQVRVHLTQCEKCFDLVRINLALAENGSSAVPVPALEKAKSIFKPTTLQRVRQFLSGSPQAAPGLAPAFALRGNELAHSTGLSSHVKDLGPYRAEVEVEKNLDDSYQVRVWVYDRSTKTTVSGMRASLKDQDHELESLVIEKGRAIFEPVPEGDYLLKISHQSMFLGGLAIRLKGKGDGK